VDRNTSFYLKNALFFCPSRARTGFDRPGAHKAQNDMLTPFMSEKPDLICNRKWKKLLGFEQSLCPERTESEQDE
jgi:hypothetical protein